MDLSLSSEERQIQETFRKFFANECALDRVRAAEEFGFDAELWNELDQLGAASIGSGDEFNQGTLFGQCLVTEVMGSTLAPVPLIEVATARRLLSRVGALASVSEGVKPGGSVITLALRPPRVEKLQLVPAGSVANAVIYLDGQELRLIEVETLPSVRSNLACNPLADVDVSDARYSVLMSGDRAPEFYRMAQNDWKTLLASALSGLARSALELGVEYTKTRVQFGVPIATFQSIAHRLADCCAEVSGAQLIAYEAAWAADHDPDRYPMLAAMALAFCTEVARKASRESLHFHGGYGFIAGSDIELFFRRAQGWPLLLGDSQAQYQVVAREYLETRSEHPYSA